MFYISRKGGKKYYFWVETISEKVLAIDFEPTIIMDRELVLMNAIKIVFPKTINHLYVWYIEKSILVKCKP